MKKLLFLLTVMLPIADVASAQVSNDNEDAVMKMDARRSRYDYVEGEVLVKFKDANRIQVNRARKLSIAKNSGLTSLLEKYGVEEMEQVLPNENPNRQMTRTRAFNGETIVEKDLSQLYFLKLSKEHQAEAPQLVEELQAQGEVEFAEPNYRLYALEDATIDGYSGGNPYAASQWYLEDYGVTTLWNKPIINKTRPVIAILDTGVDMTHPDLADNLWTNAGEYQGEKGYDNDGNGFKNDLHGWDFINNTANIRDFNAHGTHVAGIAAASNNGIGIVGANPKALIMPVTVMQSDGSGDVATIIKGVNYAIQNGATILNMSLGTYANSKALRQALENAYHSAVIVAAAGNDGLQILPVCKPREPYGPMFPAAYSFVLGVMATGQDGSLAGFSNYDCDGPNFSSTSSLQDPDGFNYELKAPGTAMYSTLPGGKYGSLNGTSMAAPLVAGSISALQMVKHYDSQEILWGDLLHTENISQAYNVTRRPAELDLIKVMYRERKELSEETEEDYGGDGRIDAGETISLYPVIRTTFGAASNIKMHLEMGDTYEDPNTVQILTGTVDFGLHLDAYGKGVSLNPLKLKVADNVANGRHIKMKFVATCDETNTIYEGHFTMIVDNMRKIYGMINEDMTLTADHEWLVSSSVAIPEGVTVTIEPGTTIRFNDNTGISNAGTLVADGTPEKPIVMIPNQTGYWKGVNGATLRYCKLTRFRHDYQSQRTHYDNCELTDVIGSYLFVSSVSYSIPNVSYNTTNILDSYSSTNWFASSDNYIVQNTNIANSGSGNGGDNETSNYLGKIAQYPLNNWLNTFAVKKYYFGYSSGLPITLKPDNMPYFGTSNEDNLRKYIYELGNDEGQTATFAWYDLTNMRTTPVTEAHGIVWKVVVNGYDAQDQYDELPPLGVGKHKFEVYFNRPMNKAVAPEISFGVRDPWTQQVVNEDGSWNAEGTVYTVYKTITGRTKSDGVNRIYVRGAQDNEFFEIPYEKTRFNIMVNAAGSMATGFMAEAGMGRVNLTWNNANNNFEDAMGFNVYRYTEGNQENPTRINESIIDAESTSYTDYDVAPGTTYNYYYKVLSTDLQEYDVSNVVAATPLTASRGDANGDGGVNVLDVTTTVSYIVGTEPKPFVFEAADMNTDQAINVLDVVGIVNKILNPGIASISSYESAQEAVYTIENGVLYIETPVALAGLQLQLSVADRDQTLTPAASLKGFEKATTWLSDNDFQLLSYNIGGRKLAPGKHAIMTIGDAELSSIYLSDSKGGLVRAVAGSNTTAIKDAMGSKVMNEKGVYNLKGQKLSGDTDDTQKLQRGVYIINGKKIVK